MDEASDGQDAEISLFVSSGFFIFIPLGDTRQLLRRVVRIVVRIVDLLLTCKGLFAFRRHIQDNGA
jgi:hypothetical protein